MRSCIVCQRPLPVTISAAVKLTHFCDNHQPPSGPLVGRNHRPLVVAENAETVKSRKVGHGKWS